MEEIKRRRLTARERNQLFNMFNGRCAYCGIGLKNMGTMQADHKVPLANGGADTMENMFPACRICNYYKHTFDVEGFRKYLSGISYRLIHNNVVFNVAVRYGIVKHISDDVTFYFERAEGVQYDDKGEGKAGDQ